MVIYINIILDFPVRWINSLFLMVQFTMEQPNVGMIIRMEA